MSKFDRTPVPVMMNCPKCDFQQPADQYCAKCGVDMTKVPVNPAHFLKKALKQPAVFAGIGVVALIVTVGAVRSLRHKPVEQDDSRSRELRARVSEKAQNNFANADARAQALQENEQDTSYSADLSSTSAQVYPLSDVATSTVPTASVPTGPAAKTETSVKTATEAASQAAPLQVTFAWAEASREWLNAMGASTPGLHRVADLDTRLRESVGGFKILEVQKQHLADKSDSILLSHGANLSVRFETASANETVLTGSIQPAMRAADGSVRSPAAAAVSIDKGHGSIVTLGANTTPLTSAPSPAATEIVLLILPRWGSERNAKP